MHCSTLARAQKNNTHKKREREKGSGREGGRKNQMMLREGECLHSRVRSPSATKARGREGWRDEKGERERLRERKGGGASCFPRGRGVLRTNRNLITACR